MLNASDLIIFKNADGLPSALGYPINSVLLQNNKSLFFSGGANKPIKSDSIPSDSMLSDFMLSDLAFPAGLLCFNEKINEALVTDDDEKDVISDNLYNQLLALAEPKSIKKLSKNNKKQRIKSNKTRKLK